MTQTTISPVRALFEIASYRNFWLGRVFSTVSFQMTAVAVGWQLYAMTHSTFALGMIGLAQYAPMVLLMLVVGHVADRVRRQLIISVCRAAVSLSSFALAVASFTGHLRPIGLFCAVAVLGASRAFENPSTQALVPSLVASELVPTAIAWSSAANQTATIIGPALGGLLYILGPQVPYALCGVLYLLASILSLRVRLWKDRKPPVATASSIFSGIHYVRAHKNILGSISLDLFAVLLGGATALLPAFARDVLHTGSWGLGLLRLCPAVGALSTSVYLAHHPIRRSAGRKMFLAVIVYGMTTILFALSHRLWLSMAALMLLGAADVFSVVIRTTMVQLETPDAMRGRVSAVNFLFIGTSNQLGEFESGVTASWFGLVPATVVGGVGSILVALVWMRLFPGLRKLDDLHGESAH